MAAAIEDNDLDAVILGLTVRQRRFAEEYIIDFNGAAATVRAGYAPHYADRQAHLLLKHAGVAFYIDHLTRTKENKIVSVNPEYVIQGIIAILNKEAARDGDKLRGYELLARHLGMLTDKHELTGKDGGALAVEQRRVEEEASSFTNLLIALAERQAREKKEVSLVD
jgi:phage terminase small subunit